MEKYLVTKEEIEAYEGIHKTHFLNQNAQRLNKSLGDLTGLSGLGFHIIEVPPGRESTELHLHYHEDECVYILEGTAEATIGDEVYSVKAGDFIGYRAGGKPHKLKNNADTVLKCIVVGQRLEHDVGEYTKLNKRLYRNKGLKWNLVDIENIDEPVAGKKVPPIEETTLK
ncbi:MAG: cupin domain-containing protein [Symploca sp. SIO1B1]|nr:cupin domain-containing protein [Symploca sp. SIO1C2]NER47275.1 cupin domain-containing protein [Symploca sp. SIO1A3]NER95092.1 cupin domain-containing protein [Symploca sp. SIO1B1]